MFTLISCSNGGIFGGSTLSGKPGELLIVINDEYKNSEVSVSVNEIMNQYEIGLTQSESPFNILMISTNHFSNVFRPHRNILFIDINSKYNKPQINFRKDLWTKDQSYVGIRVKDAASLEKILKLRHDNIIDYFIKAEINRYIASYQEAPDKKIQNAVKTNMNLMISIPEGYEINKQTKGFTWLSLETKDYSQGIIIYDRPYKDTNQLNKWPLLTYRDSIVKVHIPGPTKGSYMTTEYILPVQYKVGRYVGNNYSVELRGKWRVEHDFMAGPFISYSFVDSTKKRLFTIEGYVYYPHKSKRNYMRQLQAICQSVSFSTK
jgi:hypothetical protein